jgi:hypothetical protein
MPYSATFTLTAGSSANVGPFSIVGNPGSVSLATGVTRTQLLDGQTYNNIADTVTSFTITSSGTCTNSITKETNPATPTPTVTDNTSGMCYSLTYDTLSNTPPASLNVRYRNMSDNLITSQINTMQGMDNGDGTVTIYICVNQSGSYSEPICVEFGIEGVCTGYSWIQGSACQSESDCLLN